MKHSDATSALSEVLDPGWQRWLDLVTLSATESQHPAWSGCVHPRANLAPDAPLLHEATLRVDAGRAREFVMRLADDFGVVARERVDPLAFILAGVERDSDTMDSLANRLAISTDTMAVLTQLCALPLLLNAAKTLDAEASRTWQRGYCPVCGAWPGMVEMRGIQRERRLRCGCCGADWVLPVLRCAFCAETDHTRLGFLMTEQGEQQVRVETCSTCRGYLKTVTTLGALPFTTLGMKDLSTVAFDLAARDRGFSRPARPGSPVSVEVAVQ